MAVLPPEEAARTGQFPARPSRRPVAGKPRPGRQRPSPDAGAAARRGGAGLRRERHLVHLAGAGPGRRRLARGAVGAGARPAAHAGRARLSVRAGRPARSTSGRAGEEGIEVPPGLARAIAAIEGPAYGLDSLWNARGWNRPAAALFIGWLGGPASATCCATFSRARWRRKMIVDWPARDAVCSPSSAPISAATWRMPRCRRWSRTCGGRSALFTQCWTEHAVVDRTGGERIFDHPTRGPPQLRADRLRAGQPARLQAGDAGTRNAAQASDEAPGLISGYHPGE